MESPIKKSRRLLPKMFRVFTLYIFVTLAVFFGYVQVFGGLKPTAISLPTGGVNANEDTAFSDLVANIMSVKSLSADDFSLSAELNGGETRIAVEGDVAFVTETQSVYLDLDVVYNDKFIEVGAVYTTPDLYLTLAGETYKFEVAQMSGNFDVQKILDLVMQYVDIDINQVGEALAKFGLDINDIGSIMQKLSIENKDLEDGGRQFLINLGSILSAQIITDKDFNIESVRLRDIKLGNNTIKFKAPNILMNNVEIADMFTIPETYTDLSGGTAYIEYAKNLLSNDVIKVEADVTAGGQNILANLYIDKADGLKVKAEANVEGIDVSAVYCDKMIYVDVESLKFSFNIDDYKLWADVIEEIVENHTSKKVADIAKEFVKKFAGFDLESVDVNNINIEQQVMALISGVFDNFDKVNELLPQQTNTTENSFEMIWNSGLTVSLTQTDDVLSEVDFAYNGNSAKLVLSGVEENVVVSGDYFDVTNLIPLVRVADKIVLAQQAEGQMVATYGDYSLTANYEIDFTNGINAKVVVSTPIKDIEIYANTEYAYLVFDELVLEVEFAQFETYLQDIKELLNVQLTETESDLSVAVFGKVKELLNTISVENGEETIMSIGYLSHSIAIDTTEDAITFGYTNNNLEVSGNMKSGSGIEISMPNPTDTLSSLLAKAKNLKEYIEGKAYGAQFVVKYKDYTIYGNVQADLNRGVYSFTALYNDLTLSVRYENGKVYAEINNNKVCGSVENGKELVEMVLGLLRANGIECDLDIDTDQYLGIAKDMLPELSVAELCDNLALHLVGNLDNLALYGNYNLNNFSVATKFTNDKLKKIEINAVDFKATINITAFGLSNIDETEYYDIFGAQKGTLSFDVDGEQYVIDVELDLTNKIYMRAQTEFFGENFEVILLDNMLYVRAGEITLGTNLENASEFLGYVLSAFNVEIPTFEMNFDIEMLKDLDLEQILSQLAFEIVDGNLSFECENLKLQLAQSNDVVASAPTTYEDMADVVEIAKAVMNALENKTLEFDFAVEYGEYTIVGNVKFDGNRLEAVASYENYEIYVRYENSTIYFAYGDMKVKLDVTQLPEVDLASLVETIKEKLTAYNVDLSGFESMLEKVEGLKNVSAFDLLEDLRVSLKGSLSNLLVEASVAGKDVIVGLEMANFLPVSVTANFDNTIWAQLVNIKYETEIDEITDQYYDLADLFNLVDFVEDVLSAEKLEGTINASVAGQDIEVDYVVDFADGLKAKLSTSLFGERVTIFATTNDVVVQIGEVLVRAEIDKLDEYIAKLDELFDLDLAEKFEELKDTEIDVKETILSVLGELQNVSLAKTEENILVVNYKDNRFALSYEEGVLKASLAGEYPVALTAQATDTVVSIPQTDEDIETVLEKVENLIDYVNGKVYAVEFACSYDEYALSGVANVDLENNVFAVELTYQNTTIKVIYKDEVAYIDFEGNKLQVSVLKVQDLLDIVLPVLEANGLTFEMPDVDMMETIKGIIGEELFDLTIEDLFDKLTLDVDGSLNALSLYVQLATEEMLNANVSVEFVENKLKSVDVDVLGLLAHVEVVDFAIEEFDAEEYYDILAAQNGTLTLNIDGTEIVVNLELDLTGNIYLHAQTTALGEEFEVFVLDNMLYIKAGELSVGTDLANVKELVDTIVDAFGLTLEMPEIEFDVEQFKDINIEDILNKFALTAINGSLSFEYNDVALALTYADVTPVVPEHYEELSSMIDVAQNIKEMLENKLVEAGIIFTFNGFDLVGTFKYNQNDIEVVVDLAGEDLIIRKHDETLYVAYGNMKWKFAIVNGASDMALDIKEVLRNITSDDFAVEFNFGTFEKLVTMLRDFTLQDYLDKVKIDLNGNLTDILINVLKEDENIAKAEFEFENNKLSIVEFVVCDNLGVQLYIDHVASSTMMPFDEDDYADYNDDILETMLDSMKIRENVYALTSDIAFRYSNNAFYGEIATMVTYDEAQETMLGHFVPALQIHTTALGLNTYIYLIDERIYIDVQGLQIYADLNETTINDVVDFVEEYFGMTLNIDTAEISSLASFRYILPALDKIYGSWVDTLIENVSYNGIQILFDDEFWYGDDSRFEKTILQAFTDNDAGMIIPRKVIIGANIIDPNTTIYDDYSNYWLDNEEDVTKELNFAGYLTNLKVGAHVDNLNEIFVGSDYENITALKSNYGTSNLEEYNSYKTIIEMVETVLDYANGLKYQGSINADISGATNLKVGANINIEIGDLAPGETNPQGFKLFDDKYVKVQGAFSLKNTVEHLINIFYESNKTSALYATYTHGDFIKSSSGTIKQRIDGADKTFKAKINTVNMSEIVAMVLKFANINLGEELEENLDLEECLTDFSYVQSLLGIGGKDIESELSQGDQLIGTIEGITGMLKNIRLTKVGNTLTLSVVVDWQEHDATANIIFKQESTGLKLRKISVNNFVFSENTINLEINFEDFDSANFNYNTSASHIDFSDVSSFIDVAVTTLNTKNWAFNGSANVSLGGGLYTVNVSYDLYACLDENNELYMYIELDVPFKASVTGQALPNPDYTVYIVGGSYDRRTSVLEYKNGYLTIVQYTYGIKTTAFSSKSDKVRGYGHGDNWRYSSDQIAANAMQIMAQALGLSETAYAIIKTAINAIDPHPTLEEALLAFSKTSSGYSLKVNAENLTGMNGVEDMTLNITTSKAYNVKIDGVDQGQHKFIESISTELKIGSILSVPVTLKSVNGTSYRTTGGKVIYTNDYYRQLYAYQIKTLQFESNCSEYFAAVVKPAADPITLPTPTNYVVDNGVSRTSYTFAGWYTTSNFADGTEYTENKMPLDDTTLYAKWNVETKYYRNVTFETNASQYAIDSIYALEGTMFNLQTLEGYVVDDGETVKTYTFGGWYTTANFAEGTQMTLGVVPSQDTTLYARWIVDTKYYRVVSFETNSIYSTDEVYDVEGRSFALPTYETYDADNGVTYEVYTFAGWYTTANFAQGTQVTVGIIPSQDTILYAKWNADVQYYRTVSFETNSVEEIADVKQLVGTQFTIPTPRQKQETEGYLTTFYTFAGWYTTADFVDGTQFATGIIPSADLTIYAKWDVERIVRSYQINLYDENEFVDSTRAVAGESFNLSQLSRVYEDTLFYTDSSFEHELESFIMPEKDLNIYIRNRYSLSYYHYVLENNTYVEKEDVVMLYQGEAIDFLPTQTNTYIDYKNASNELSYRVYFEFSEYSNVAEHVTAMPNHSYCIVSTMTTTRVDYHVVTLYDNGSAVDSMIVLAGDALSFEGRNKVNSTTLFYTDANYTTLFSSTTMPNSDINVHVRNKYTLTYSYYKKENNDYVKKTATKMLYQGESFDLPAQSNDEIDYKNSSNELAYRKYFTFGAYSNVADGISVMTNHDYTISNTMTTSTKNYYKIVFDVRTYKVSGMVAGYAWKTGASFTPATEYHFAGDTINLNQDKYKPSATGWKTAIHTNTVLCTYKTTTWGKSAWSNGTAGGKGFTSYTVSASDTASDNYTITLYGCWKQV